MTADPAERALRVSEHLRRYAPLYAFGTLWVLMLMLFPTIDGSNDDSSASGNAVSELAGGSSTGGGGPSNDAPAAGGDGSGSGGPTGDGGGDGGTAVAGASAGPTNVAPGGGPVAAVQAGTGVTRGGFECKPGARQIPWAAYTAPCVGRFGGNNGGATYRGVTATEIRIARRKTADTAQGAVVDQVQARAGFPNDETLRGVEQAFVDHFNKTFELYGRRVVFVDFQGQGNATEEAQGRGQEVACADARALADLNVFGVINWEPTWGVSQPFSECAAMHIEPGLFVPMGAAYNPERSYRRWHPHVWHTVTECERIVRQVAEYAGKRLAGRKAKWAGEGNVPDYRTQTRAFGIYVPDNDGYQHCINIMEDRLEGDYGVKTKSRYNYGLDVSRFADQAAQAVIQFKAAGVTTLVNACDPISTIFLTQAANNQRWYPEWLVIGVALQDTDNFGNLYEQNQVVGHLFGMSQLGTDAKIYAKDGEAYRTYKAARPNAEPPEDSLLTYSLVADLFNKLQAAGPVLTPANIAAGLQKLPPFGGDAGPFGTWSYADDHTAIDDSREVYWVAPDTRTDSQNGKYVETYGGKRFGDREWPKEEPPIYPKGPRVSRPAARIAAGAVALWLAWWVLDALLPRGLPGGLVILGLVYGSLYAIGAVGIVLIYRANRVVNFAQTEMGSVAAVIAIELVVAYDWNYFPAIGTGLVVAAFTGFLVERLVIRRFDRAPRLIVAVATIAVAQILNGIALLIPLWIQGPAAGSFETPFQWSFQVFPVVFNGNHLVAIVSVVAVLGALVWFLRFTDYGVAIRAAAENGDRAGLLGVPVKRLATVVWMIAAVLSALAVILRVPIVGFSSFASTSGAGYSLLMRTLAAAVIGRMESLPVTVGAALALGVLEQFSAWTFSNGTYVDAVLVAIILLALLAQRGRLSRAADTGIATWQALREVRPIPAELRSLPEVRWTLTALRAALLIGALVLPIFASASQEQLAGLIVIYALVAVSLVVLTGWAGQISLGQFALVGFGTAASGVLLTRAGLDLFLALPAGAMVSAAVAVLIGLPALRITGPFLAVTTLAFAVTSSTFLLEDRYFGWFIEETVNRPNLWGRISINEDWQMYYLGLVVLVLVITAVRSLRTSRTGRAIIAVRDNPAAAQTFGVSAVRLKLTAFVVSGAIAGLAGGLYGLHQHGLQLGEFSPEKSVRLFSMVVIGGLGSIPGAVLGAVYIRGAEFFLSGGWTLIASGFGIIVLLMFFPGGLGELLYRIRDGLLRMVARRRRLVVPSLVADVRVEGTGPPVELGTTLGGLRAADEREPAGVGTGT